MEKQKEIASGGNDEKTEWIRCPVCGNKTRDRIREDTVLKNYPLYCPKCKQESLNRSQKSTNNSNQKSQTHRRRADNTENSFILGYRLILLES